MISRFYKLVSNPNIQKDENALRIGKKNQLSKSQSLGILGAAKIAPTSLIQPAKFIKEVKIVGIASRSIEKAESFAKKYSIPKIYSNYDDLINDDEIDAIYNPLPNGLHGKYTIMALEKGKHVLCEKPFAANQHEAQLMKESSEKNGKVALEAFHYRFHPSSKLVKKLLTDGEIGKIKHVKAKFIIPNLVCKFMFDENDIRFNYSLAGGALMDGCYVVNVIRFVMGEEPIDVTNAKAALIKPNVDRRIEFSLSFQNGATAEGIVDFFSNENYLPTFTCEIIGEKGEMLWDNFILPHSFHSIKVKNEKGSRTIKEYGDGQSTYFYQLKAFIEKIKNYSKDDSDIDDAILNQKVIDAIYEKAGLPKREPTK